MVRFVNVESGGRLTAVFVEQLTALDDSAADNAVSEEELANACARARVEFGDLHLDDEVFVRHLAKVSARGTKTSPSSLFIEDLFLACACMVKVPGAAEALYKKHGAAIRASITGIVSGPDAAEIEQQLMDGLLVGTALSPGKIGSYAGHAPIGRWLQVSARREALMWLRASGAEIRARSAAAAEPPGESTDPEIAYLRERYCAEFEAALKEALARVGERERALLRLYLVNGLSLESIGKMFGVSQPTASRWLAQTRGALLDDIKGVLRIRLGVSSHEMASIAGLVASRLDMSLSQLLGDDEG